MGDARERDRGGSASVDPPLTEFSIAPKPRRNHHIDALRVSAIFLLIPYHSARYVQKGLTDSTLVDGVVWFVHLWHMPLFFAISGYLAAGAMQRSSLGGQVKSRLRRLGVPLAIGMLTVVPLANLFVILSARLRPRAQDLPPGRELELGNIFTTTPRHLWFLVYLLAISLVVIVVVAIARRGPAISAALVGGFQRLVRSPLAILPFGLLTGSILLLKSGWVAGGSVASSLIPRPSLLLYYAAFFSFGALIAGRENVIESLRRGAWLRLGLGVALAVPAFLLFYDSADFTGDVGESGTWVEAGDPRIVGLFAIGLICWLTMLGIWGVLARYVRSESRILSYLSDASFFVYLIHIPFLVALQSSLTEIDMYLPLRYAITVTGTLLLSVGTYALLVRHTPVGTWLHGARHRGGPHRDEAQAATG